jgi:hypothetical protein
MILVRTYGEPRRSRHDKDKQRYFDAEELKTIVIRPEGLSTGLRIS